MQATLQQTSTFDNNNPKVQKFKRRFMNPVLQWFVLLVKLPSAVFMRVRLKSLEADVAEATVKFGWRSQNPFRSTYFVSLFSAAELSTGAICMLGLQGRPPISMLLVNAEGDFIKKAADLTTFRCEEGGKIMQAIQDALDTGEGQTTTVESVGRNKAGEIVAKMKFTWSFKVKRKK